MPPVYIKITDTTGTTSYLRVVSRKGIYAETVYGECANVIGFQQRRPWPGKYICRGRLWYGEPSFLHYGGTHRVKTHLMRLVETR